MLSKAEQNTLNTYNRIAKNWSSTRRDNKNIWAAEHKKFKQLLPTGLVLDIGCGPGRDPVWFTENGYECLGIDGSQAMVILAKENNPKADFELRTFYEISPLGKKFNGIWAAASLLHVPKKRIAEVLKDIKGVMLPNAIGFISLKQGQGENNAVWEKDNLTRFYSYYELDEFEQILKAAGLSVLEGDKQVSLRNGKTVWLTYFVKS